MTTLYENFTTLGGVQAARPELWYFQTFKVSKHTITSVMLHLGQIGTPTVGNYIVSLRATSEGLPTGEDLTSISVPQGALAGGWYNFIFSAEYTPLINHTYAIAFRTDAFDYSNYWEHTYSSGYADGNNGYSEDGGLTWTASASDVCFKIYGNALDFVVTESATGSDRVWVRTQNIATSFYGVYIYEQDTHIFRAYNILNGSLKINKVIGSRPVTSFTIIDIAGNLAFYQNQAVLIYDSSDVLIFSGVIKSYTVTRLSPDGSRLWQISCQDWWILTSRVVYGAYTSTTAGAIVADLFSKYLASEGLTIGEIQGGIALDSYDINFELLGDKLTNLAEKSNFLCFIDKDRRLFFIDKTTYSAPWTLTTADVLENSNPSCEFQNSNYRNVQYSKDFTLGDSPSNPTTEDITIEKDQSNATQKVFLLGNIPASITSIKQDGVAKTVGILGIDSGKDWYWQPNGLLLVAAVAPYYVDPATSTTIEIIYAPATHTAFLGHLGYSSMLVGTWLTFPRVADDAKAMASDFFGGTGIIEDVLDESDKSENQAWMDAKYTYGGNAVEGGILKLTTSKSGLEVGQYLGVTLPVLNLASVSMLIESIMVNVALERTTYDITCTYGPAVSAWRKFWKTSGPSYK